MLFLNTKQSRWFFCTPRASVSGSLVHFVQQWKINTTDPTHFDTNNKSASVTYDLVSVEFIIASSKII